MTFLPKNYKGFSLIEMTVAVGIFSVAALIGVTSLLSLVAAQRKAIAIQSAYDNLRFAVEIIAKDLRTGDVFYCGNFTGGFGSLGPNDCRPGSSSGATAITFLNAQGTPISYRLNASSCGAGVGAVERSISGGDWEPLTGCDVNMQDFRFYVTGALPSSGESIPFQSMLTIIARGTAGGGLAASNFSLETTITQRIVRQ